MSLVIDKKKVKNLNLIVFFKSLLSFYRSSYSQEILSHLEIDLLANHLIQTSLLWLHSHTSLPTYSELCINIMFISRQTADSTEYVQCLITLACC